MNVLKVENVSIRYLVGDFKNIGLKDYVLKKLRGEYRVSEFWADRHVSFTLDSGEMLGIIGTNGAGKSTLLKAVSGIMEPTEGRVRRKGNVAALLELASGFDGELTVRENTYLRGAMLGYTRKFMDEKYDEIIAFAELQDFQDYAFRQLSSGMKSRLAFSIASMVKPDLLILDEVLSVGDGAFRKKSEEKMMEIIHGGAATILVSHSPQQVRQLCTKVLWLDHGKQIALTEDVETACTVYQRFLDKEVSLDDVRAAGEEGMGALLPQTEDPESDEERREEKSREEKSRGEAERTQKESRPEVLNKEEGVEIATNPAGLQAVVKNKVIGAPQMNNSRIIFRGENNILLAEDGVSLTNSTVEFHGRNSVVYLSRSRHPYKVNISLYHNSACYFDEQNYFNGNMHMIASEECNILFGKGGTHSHGIWLRTADSHLIYDMNTHKRVNFSNGIFVGDHVWLGQDALLLKGAEIGSGSVISARAVVSGRQIPSNTIWGGVPAKLLKRDIFWQEDCVHAWTAKETKARETDPRNSYVYNVAVNKHRTKTPERQSVFRDINNLLRACADAEERLAVLRSVREKRDKDRFAIGEEQPV